MPHRVIASTSLFVFVLIGSLAAGCQSAPSGAPTTPAPAGAGRGAEAVGTPDQEVGPGGSNPVGAGGAPGTGSQQGCIDGPLLKYVGQSPDQCARMRFVCEPGWTYFSDDCGCGCTKQP
ncbi:hypothetical protein WMF28_39465 [Sorangium sp. So ce590]|uniref:hypothetical protein n=1 Tax=Sorangium sp. So ce590 TaxID=3133317 RepID=UPI003F5DA17C